MSNFVSRRDVIGMGSAVLGLAALMSKRASAQSGSGCQSPQHFFDQFSSSVHSTCSNQDIQINETFKTTVQTCLNADGSVTYKMRQHSHGTGQSYDPTTGQLTGTKYIINDQSNDISITEPPGGCPGLFGQNIASDAFTFRQELVSQGSAPNEYVVLHETATVDSSCHFTFHITPEIDCHG